MSVLARATVVLNTDLAAFHAGLSSAETALQGAGRKMTAIGAELSTKLTLPLLAAGGVSVKTAAQFDESMRKISALTDTSAETVAGWRDEVRQLAIQYGATGTAAGEALFSIASSGITGAAAMETLRAALIGSAIGLGTAATVSDAATSAMNAYARAGMTATRATEILAAGVNYGKMEADQLAPVLGSLTGISSALNISFEDVVATLAVFSLTGTNAAEGATQLSAIMSTMLGGSKEAEDALASVGLTLADLRDVAAGPQGLIKVMRLLEDRFDGQLDKLALVIPNIRAFRGVMNALAQDTATVDKVFEGVTKSQGNLGKSLAEMQGPALQLRQAWAQITDAFISTGEVLAPIVVPALLQAATAVRELATWFGALSPTAQDFIVIAAAMAAALGPLLVALGGIVTLIGTLTFAAAIAGFGSLTGLLMVGAPLLVGLAAIGGLWYQARLEMNRAAAAAKAAGDAMDVALQSSDPSKAAAKVEHFNRVIARYTARQNELQAQMQKRETFLRGRLGDDAFEGRTFNLDSLSRPVRQAWREFEALADRIEDVGLQIDDLRHSRGILEDVAGAFEAGKTAPPAAPPAALPGAAPVWQQPARDAVLELQVELTAAKGMGAALGKEFNLVEAEAQAYLTAVRALTAAGVPLDQVVGRNGETVNDLANRYQSLTLAAASTKRTQDEFNAAMEEAERLVELTRTPLDEYLQAHVVLTQALVEGRISQDEYNAAMKKAQEMMQEATVTTSELRQGLVDLTGRAVDDFIDMALAGKQSFGDFVRSALYDLAKLILKLQLMKLLFGKDGKGGWLGAIKIPAFARGGYLPGGEVGLVGEKGPELITGGRGGVRITPMPSLESLLPPAEAPSVEMPSLESLLPPAEAARLEMPSLTTAMFPSAPAEVAPNLLDHIFGYARGGFLDGGEVGLVGERGPELIAGGRGGVRITPMPAMSAANGGGGGTNLKVEVNVNAIDSRGVAEFFEQNEGLVASAMMKATRKSGLLSRGVGG